MTDETMDKALMLIRAVESELRQGTKHYNAAGALLRTPREILLCLTDEGCVTIESCISLDDLRERAGREEPS